MIEVEKNIRVENEGIIEIDTTEKNDVIQLDVLNYAKEWEKKKYGSLVSVNWSMDDYNSII